MSQSNRYSMFDATGTYLVDQLIANNSGDYAAAFAELDNINAGKSMWSPIYAAFDFPFCLLFSY